MALVLRFLGFPLPLLQGKYEPILNGRYVMPILPLVFALFAGRTFCAAVCPLGAAQDIVDELSPLAELRSSCWSRFYSCRLFQDFGKC